MALRLMDSLTCFPVVHCISSNVVTSRRSGPCTIQLFLIFVIGFHLDRSHPTFVSALGLFPESASELHPGVADQRFPHQRGLEPTILIRTPIVSASIPCAAQGCFRICHLVEQQLEICLANVHVFHCTVTRDAKLSRLVLNLPHVPMSISKTWVHRDSLVLGLDQRVPR